MQFCMPSRWNIGATASTTDSGVLLRQICEPTAAVIMVPCVCMQPLGWPVVPEV
ncbi:hypothetical protein D3C81_1525590 [compost metagenome]